MSRRIFRNDITIFEFDLIVEREMAVSRRMREIIRAAQTKDGLKHRLTFGEMLRLLDPYVPKYDRHTKRWLIFDEILEKALADTNDKESALYICEALNDHVTRSRNFIGEHARKCNKKFDEWDLDKLIREEFKNAD